MGGRVEGDTVSPDVRKRPATHGGTSRSVVLAGRDPGRSSRTAPCVRHQPGAARCRADERWRRETVLVEIWSDIACPWCYIGKRRFEEALRGFEHRDDVAVVWRSFELDPSAPREQPESQPELLARKYRVAVAQAEAMNARMTTEAAKEGLEFHLDRSKVGNTFDAHRLLHLAGTQDRRDALTERLFAAYLTEGKAIGNPDVLTRLAADVGIDPVVAAGVLASDRFAADVRRDEARAQALGITGVPFFVLDSRYGISGAQPAELLREALKQAWDEGAAAPLVTRPADAGDGCEDGSCTI